MDQIHWDLLLVVFHCPTWNYTLNECKQYVIVSASNKPWKKQDFITFISYHFVSSSILMTMYFRHICETKGFRVYAKVFAGTAFSETKAKCRGGGENSAHSLRMLSLFLFFLKNNVLSDFVWHLHDVEQIRRNHQYFDRVPWQWNVHEAHLSWANLAHLAKAVA